MLARIKKFLPIKYRIILVNASIKPILEYCVSEQQLALKVSSSDLLHGLTKKGWDQYPDLEDVPLELAQVSYHLRIVLMHILHSGTVSV